MLNKIYSLLIIILFLSACNDETGTFQKSTFIDLNDLRQAVIDYNNTAYPGNHEGIIIDAFVDINHLENDNGDFILEFLVENTNTFRKFDFQYERTKGQIKMPSEIKQGRVAFLGDNLIIQDLDKQENYSFLVEGYQDRFKENNPIAGIGLGSNIYESKVALRSSAGSCTCSCDQCINCEYNCGTAQASCTCNGNTQSRTCRPCYNASCTQCPDE